MTTQLITDSCFQDLPSRLQEHFMSLCKSLTSWLRASCPLKTGGSLPRGLLRAGVPVIGIQPPLPKQRPCPSGMPLDLGPWKWRLLRDSFLPPEGPSPAPGHTAPAQPQGRGRTAPQPGPSWGPNLLSRFSICSHLPLSPQRPQFSCGLWV